MRVGRNALHGMFSDRQTFLFKGVCAEPSVHHRILNRSMAQTHAQTDPRPSGQRGNDPSTSRHDGFIGRYWFLFNFRIRRIPSE